MRAHQLGSFRVRVSIGGVLVVGVLTAVLNAALGVGGSVVADVVLPWFGELVLAGAVAAIALRVITVRTDRSAWLALGCGALFWLGGDVYRTIAFPPGTHRFFPSFADVGYLLLYPCMYVGLWLLIRARASSFQRSLWLDGLIGAAGVAAIGATLVVDVVLVHRRGSFSTVATNGAYPLGDVLLLAQLVAAMALSRWRPGRTWLFIAAGLGIFSVADIAYAYTSALGQTYVVALGPLWVLAFVLVAVGAWQRDAAPLPRVRLEGIAVLVVPLTFALVATALLAYGQTHRLPDAAAALAVITLLLVVMRTALTFRENLALLDNRRAALTDELTGLPNRRRLNQRIVELTEAKSTAGFAGLLLVDLDGFKELNDTLGHHAGDVLLSSLGSRLSAVGGLELVARLGGDEFAVLVARSTEPDPLRAAADLVHAVLETPFEFDDLSIHIRASIGGALFPRHGSNMTELMRRADVAMYSAKGARNGFELYRADRDLNSRDRLRLVGELRRALREGELILHYQPKADAQTGEITGVEALVRWEHPTDGLLTPDRFLDVAESAGLMRELTSYVLQRALRQLALWQTQNANLRVAVNLAMPNLLDLRLPDEVARLLDETGVAATHLVLEITENIVMADPARIVDVVGRLHTLGVKLSLDDFGAGASSLGYLKRLSLSELKIDRSFVMAMEDEDNAAIVHATIDLAHRLGLRVVAEGVETAANWRQLKTWQCDEIQGFLLGRPMPAEQLAPRLALSPDRAGQAAHLAGTDRDRARHPATVGSP